ncbi:hypothetical protein ISS37_02275 [candidate division KSB1 bacterium]|nr:hypothetical protein [candidate division KSB1 bacterium]
MTGCYNPFAPKLGKSGSSLITSQETVPDLLDNFKYAYTFKDSVIYSNLLDSSFVFVYYDYDQNRYLSWDRDVELRTTGRLLRYFEHNQLVWHEPIPEMTPSTQDSSFLVSFNLEMDDHHIFGDAFFTIVRNADQKLRIAKWKDFSNF